MISRCPVTTGSGWPTKFADVTRRHAIVMMTGCLDTGMAARSMRTGAMDYLRKPFTRDQLTSSLNRAMQWHRSHAAELTASAVTS